MRLFPRLVAGICRFPRPVAAGELHHEVAFVNELCPRIISHGVQASIHADGVAGARLHAVSAKDATELVDDEDFWKSFVSPPRIALGIFRRVDEDALRRTGGGAAEAGDAAWRAVVADGEPMQSAKALGIRATLFRVLDGGNAAVESLQHRIALLAQHALLHVLEEVLHGDAGAREPRGHVTLHTR